MCSQTCWQATPERAEGEGHAASTCTSAKYTFRGMRGCLSRMHRTSMLPASIAYGMNAGESRWHLLWLENLLTELQVPVCVSKMGFVSGSTLYVVCKQMNGLEARFSSLAAGTRQLRQMVMQVVQASGITINLARQSTTLWWRMSTPHACISVHQRGHRWLCSTESAPITDFVDLRGISIIKYRSILLFVMTGSHSPTCSQQLGCRRCVAVHRKCSKWSTGVDPCGIGTCRASPL